MQATGDTANFDLVMGLDWHSLPVLEALEGASFQMPPFVFLNVRVFSGNIGLSKEDREFYVDLEARCVARAARVVAQTSRDVEALRALGASATKKSETVLEGLHCPLREDLRQLASAAEVEAPRASWADGRRYLLCVARLSPEKNVEAFVAVVEELGSELAAAGTIPLLVGAPSDPPAYGEALVARLLAACPVAEYRGFGPPDALAKLYGAAKLNLHGALAEPYGMSLVEAAAFAAPTILHEEGIGAAERLRPDHGESVAVSMRDPTAVAARVRELLSRVAELEQLGMRAQARAHAWSEAEFAAAVLNELRLAVA